MKKIISCLTILCLTLSSIQIVFARDDSTSESEADAQIVLNAIGQPYNDSDEFITRAAFVEKLVSILRIGMPSAGEYFSDVDAGEPYAAALTAACEMGYISAGEFRPNDIITVTEAATIMTRALGYSVYAENAGGYPDGYKNIAQSLDLFKGMTSLEDLTAKNESIMLYNFLVADVAVWSPNGEIKVADGETILNTEYDIRCETGLLTATEVTSLYPGGSIASKDCVIIGNEMHRAPSEMSEYIGYNVKYYYIDDDINEREIVGFRAYRTNTLTISGYDVVEMNGTTLKYEVDDTGKTKNIKLGTDIDLIYNGVLKEKYSSDVFLNTAGEIVFIDNDNDGTYEVVSIKAYRNIWVGAIDNEDKIIYDKNGKGSLRLDYDSNNKIEIKKDGAPAGFEDIQQGDVLSILDNGDNSRFVRVYVVNEKLYGSVNLKNDDSIVVNASEFRTSIADELKLGDYGYFYFDILGRICAFESQAKNQYAYFIRAWQDEDSEKTHIKIYSEAGEVKDCALSDKVKIDGARCASSGAAYGEMTTVGASLIRINMNEDGEIYEIDTEKKNKTVTEDDFNKAFPNQAGKSYKSSSSIFGGICAIDGNTIVFSVPDDPSDYDGYSIKRSGYFINDYKYSFSGYDPNDVNVVAAMVISATDSSNINDRSPIGIICKVSREVDGDGEEMYKLDMLADGSNKSYFVKDDLLVNSLNIGDVIRFSLDAKDRIEELKMVYKVNGKNEEGAEISNETTSYGTFDSNYRVAVGTVVRKINDYMTVSFDSGTEIMKVDKSKTKIYMLDTRSQKSKKINISNAGVGDLFDSMSEPSKVLARTRYGDLLELIILKGVE